MRQLEITKRQIVYKGHRDGVLYNCMEELIMLGLIHATVQEVVSDEELLVDDVGPPPPSLVEDIFCLQFIITRKNKKTKKTLRIRL